MPSIRLSLIALACIAAFAEHASAQNGQPEEIYVARSVRETRVPAAEFCSRERAGFRATTEDRYAFRSAHGACHRRQRADGWRHTCLL